MFSDHIAIEHAIYLIACHTGVLARWQLQKSVHRDRWPDYCRYPEGKASYHEGMSELSQGMCPQSASFGCGY